MDKIKSIYKFLYTYIYQLYRRKQSDDSSRDYAIGITIILLEMHMGVVYSFIKGVLNIPSLTLGLGLSYGQRKHIAIPILLILFIPLFRFLKKKHERIVEPYLEKNLITTKNSVIVISMFVIPVVMIIMIQKYFGII